MSIFNQMADRLKSGGRQEENVTSEQNIHTRVDVDPHLPISILNAYGDETAQCRLLVIGVNEVTLERLPGMMQLPLYKVGDQLRIAGYTDDMIVRTYTGVVKQSSYVKLTVSDIREQRYVENRTYQRQIINEEAEIIVQGTSYKCTIADISLGGAKLVSDKSFDRNSEFELVFKLSEQSDEIRLVGKVLRTVERQDGKNNYGTMFAQLSEAQSQNLGNAILEIQKKLKESVDVA